MYTVIVIILTALQNVWPTLLDEVVNKQNHLSTLIIPTDF